MWFSVFMCFSQFYSLSRATPTRLRVTNTRLAAVSLSRLLHIATQFMKWFLYFSVKNFTLGLFLAAVVKIFWKKISSINSTNAVQTRPLPKLPMEKMDLQGRS